MASKLFEPRLTNRLHTVLKGKFWQIGKSKFDNLNRKILTVFLKLTKLHITFKLFMVKQSLVCSLFWMLRLDVCNLSYKILTIPLDGVTLPIFYLIVVKFLKLFGKLRIASAKQSAQNPTKTSYPKIISPINLVINKLSR